MHTPHHMLLPQTMHTHTYTHEAPPQATDTHPHSHKYHPKPQTHSNTLTQVPPQATDPSTHTHTNTTPSHRPTHIHPSTTRSHRPTLTHSHKHHPKPQTHPNTLTQAPPQATDRHTNALDAGAGRGSGTLRWRDYSADGECGVKLVGQMVPCTQQGPGREREPRALGTFFC